MERDVIYCKDCRSMAEVEDGAIDLIISGPPYWDYIDYSRYTPGTKTKEIRWKTVRPYESFLRELKRWYAECFRVLRPGRYCVVNLATLRSQGRCYPLPFHAVSILEALGFGFCYEILWHKLSGGRPDARGFIRDPVPGNFIPNNKVEYLLVFRKEPTAPFCVEGRDASERVQIDEVFKREIANNVWHVLPACPPISGDHPCPFPPEIPYRLIQLLSRPGETVLDPFMGIGTTARAATMLGRHFIGYELQPDFAELARERAWTPLKFRRATVASYTRMSTANHVDPDGRGV